MQTLNSLIQKLQIGKRLQQINALIQRLELERRLAWLGAQIIRLFDLIWRALLWINGNVLARIPLTPFQFILLLFVIFALLYSWATPIFEASDEVWHFAMVEYIRENADLPVQDPDGDITLWRQEGSQPPLYYAVSSVLISPFDISDADTYRVMNPHAMTGNPGSFGNRNLVLHPEEAPPLQGTVLAVHVLRLFGIALGTLTVTMVYMISLLVVPKRPVVALVAAGLTAFNPMFLFIAASVNNDNLVIALNSVAIYLMLRIFAEGFELRRCLLLALIVALASLTKLSALVLVPVIILGGVWVAYRDKNWPGLGILIAALGIFWTVIAGWWYVRNLQLYGELFGTGTMAAVAGVRANPFSLDALFSEFQGFRFSYWGVFGAFNIQLSPAFYALADMFVLMSIFGLVFLILQLIAIRDFRYARRELMLVVALIAIVSIGTVSLISWTALTYASQGRLMFPFIAAISPLLAIGAVEIVWWTLYMLRPPDGWRNVLDLNAVPDNVIRNTMLWPVRFVGLVAFLAPIFTIAPLYAAPEPLDKLPESATEVYAVYDDVALVGYDFVDRRYSAGSEVNVTLYWEVLEQSDRDNSLFLTLTSPSGKPLGKIDTYPGAGALRTSTWEVGKIYPDHYRITINRAERGRYPIKLHVGWWHYPTEERITPVDDSNRELEAVLLDIGALVSGTPNPDVNLIEGNVIFDGMFHLEGYGLNLETDELTLLWRMSGNPLEDYAVFLHVLDEDGNLVYQSDVHPELPTHYWFWNDQDVTIHDLKFVDEILAQKYTVLVGWYDPETDERLELGGDLLEDAVLENYPNAYPLIVEPPEELEATPEATPEATNEVTPGPDLTAEPDTAD